MIPAGRYQINADPRAWGRLLEYRLVGPTWRRGGYERHIYSWEKGEWQRSYMPAGWHPEREKWSSTELVRRVAELEAWLRRLEARGGPLSPKEEGAISELVKLGVITDAEG